MTTDDALDVVALIDATWPADPIPDADRRLWVTALSWRDFALTVECVMDAPWPNRPTLDELDQAYRRPPIERLRRRLAQLDGGKAPGC